MRVQSQTTSKKLTKRGSVAALRALHVKEITGGKTHSTGSQSDHSMLEGVPPAPPARTSGNDLVNGRQPRRNPGSGDASPKKTYKSRQLERVNPYCVTFRVYPLFSKQGHRQEPATAAAAAAAGSSSSKRHGSSSSKRQRAAAASSTAAAASGSKQQQQPQGSGKQQPQPKLS